MKQADIQAGGTYILKVSGKEVPVRCLSEVPRSSFQVRRRFVGINTVTGREVRFTAARARRRVWTNCQSCGARGVKLYSVRRLNLSAVCEPCGRSAMNAG